MSYKALYRTWRPLTFDNVVGQEHVTKTLKNEVLLGRIGHAYLFCGTRGTGKTSTARILSRAINCLNPKEGNPCNECENCRGILDGSILDITEIDAASNNGVDNIRNLREEARFSGSVLSGRVYIVDEVHMLSTSAFNALLKILEEPPGHVHFILATTEAHKVPATILSRCQRFDFKRITVGDIEKQLKKIIASGDTAIEDRAIHLIAEGADGSMRDALSLLDQCLSIGGAALSYDDVASFLGLGDRETAIRLIENIAQADTGAAFATVDEAVKAGKSIPPMVEELVKFLRDMLILKYSVSEGEGDGEHRQRLSLSECFTPERLVLLISQCSELQTQFRLSVNPRLTLEIGLVKMINPAYDQSAESMAARLSQLEKNAAGMVWAKPPAKEKKEVKKPEVQPPAPVSSDVFKKLKSAWKDIINGLFDKNKLQLAMALEQGKLSEDGDKIFISYDSPDEYHACKQLLDGELDSLTEIIEAVTGVGAKVSARLVQVGADKTDQLIKLYNETNM